MNKGLVRVPVLRLGHQLLIFKLIGPTIRMTYIDFIAEIEIDMINSSL